MLDYNIYSNGFVIAAYHYDANECLSYAQKAYNVGLKLGDEKRMAYPAMYLTMCYNEKNMADSAKKYMALCLNYIDDYDDFTKSDVVIINTCGFIGDAQEESVNTILGYAELRKQGKIKAY